jgi:hypothetical protein
VLALSRFRSTLPTPAKDKTTKVEGIVRHLQGNRESSLPGRRFSYMLLIIRVGHETIVAMLERSCTRIGRLQLSGYDRRQRAIVHTLADRFGFDHHVSHGE